MTLIVADRVQETSTTTGIGSYTLLGATTGYRAASTVCTNADTFTYYAEAIDANERPTGDWETGLGTWGTGNILTRTTIYASSNGGSAVSWLAGTKRIGLGLVSNAVVGPTTIVGNLTATNLSGTNTGDNAANTNYASDYRAANFIAGTNYLTPTGSAASLTNFPTLNQSTTGSAGSTVAAVTFNTTGGAAAGTTFNGSTAKTIDYSTVGASASGHTHSYQPVDGDLTAIAALAGTSGLLKKTAVDTWSLDATGYTTNTGTVTSVGGTGNISGISLSGSVTTTGNLTLGGTLAVTPSNFASQTANTVLAAPNGAAGVPTFRAVVASDIPTLNQSTTGSAATLTTARTINGISFNGSANITINAVDSTARIASSEKGVANGVATLDASGFVPPGQLPSYVDDVLEYANLAGFPVTGATGKIYVALDTNKTYRWSGTVYVYITSGAVDSVAGKTGVVSLVKADVGLGSVDNTADSTKSVSYAATAGSATASDVYAWAKAAVKPTYTAAEVGAPSGSGTSSGTNTGDQTALPNPNAVTFTSSGGAGAGSTYTGAAILTVDYSTVGAASSGHTHSYQPVDADLTAIAALAGTSGLLKKTAADTWTLDTAAYSTTTGTVTSIATTGPITGGTITSTGTIGIQVANTSQAGYLTNTDWNTFNNKQPSGAYLTAEADTLATVTSRGSTATNSITLPGAENNAYGLWGTYDTYSIAMGVTAGTYQYGPVTDYSIKMCMAGGAGRGFTWGQYGVKPIAALNSTSGDMTIAGAFSAASKSFLIKHPIKSNMQLRYGSLESPYHGVRLTGKAKLINGKCKVILPDYIHGLCKQEDSQVQITNIKHGKVIWVEDIMVDEDYFTVACNMGMFDRKTYEFYWSFTAVRKDIAALEVECS